MTRPRFTITTSFKTGGKPSLSKLGISVVMVLSTMPICCCCTKALTRKRPIPRGLIAKLHSLVASNDFDCLSFIMARTKVLVCTGVSACCETGRIAPSIFIAGGNPAVINKSDPFFATILRSKSCINLMA